MEADASPPAVSTDLRKFIKAPFLRHACCVRAAQAMFLQAPGSSMTCPLSPELTVVTEFSWSEEVWELHVGVCRGMWNTRSALDC